MDSEIIEEIRLIGRTVEAVGRKLQTKRQRWLTREEIQDLRQALRLSSQSINIYEKMIPKK